MNRIDSDQVIWVALGLVMATGSLLAGLSFCMTTKGPLLYAAPLVVAALIPGFLVGAALATRSITSLELDA